MKYLVLAIPVLAGLLAVAPNEVELSKSTVADHAILAYEYQKRHPDEACYLRFFSYYNYSPRGVIKERIQSMRFWINQLHLQTGLSFAKEVPLSDGLLWVVDLREYDWSPEAFSSVARREPYFREPAVDSATAILLRKAIGIDQDPKTLHAEAIVRADWFFRETFESDRSTSYYDLLFSRQRFVCEYPKKKEFYTEDGVQYFQWVPDKSKPRVVKFVDFPKNERDLEKITGVDKFREHLAEFKIDTRHGAVVEGSEKQVSIVARQNRLIERILTIIGSYYKTFDVKETSGKRDFAETLNKDFDFDAGEILFDLPGGGMGTFLVNRRGDRLETADNRFAIDSVDALKDARVRTPGSCFICHEDKFIKPKNLVEEMVRAGIDIRFRKKERAVDAKGFFLGWVHKLEAEQKQFARHIEQTSGMKPAANAAALKSWRDEYDDPVNVQVAAAECGVTVEKWKFVAAASTKARILMLVKGIPIPRKTWEVDGYREWVLLNDARKK